MAKKVETTEPAEKAKSTALYVPVVITGLDKPGEYKVDIGQTYNATWPATKQMLETASNNPACVFACVVSWDLYSGINLICKYQLGLGQAFSEAYFPKGTFAEIKSRFFELIKETL